MTQPLVSVVIPAFNAARTIERTLASVANQTYPNIEIIIVDDGSSDDTARLAEAFVSRHPASRLLRQANAGVAAARNKGVAAAAGQWIAPVDADDLWHPAKIERQVAAAEAADRVPGFVYCWFHLVDEQDQVIGSGSPFVVRGAALASLQLFNFVGNGSSLLIWRAALEEVGHFDSRLRAEGAQGCEDIALQLRLASRFPVEVAPFYLVGYRMLEDSMSQDGEKMQRSFELALSMFKAEGGPIDAQSVARNAAYRALRRAEQLQRSGDVAGARRALLSAMRDDPGRSAAKLGHRLLRLLRQKVRPQTRTRPLMAFAEAPIDAPMRDRDEIRWLGRALFRWDQRRLSALTRRTPR